MKKITLTVLSLFALSLSISCAGKNKKELHIYNWADYIKPEIVSAFESKFNCKVIVDYFDSNESMYAKIKSGATGYDIIVPTSYMAEVMNKENMLVQINKDKIPNIKNIDAEIIKSKPDSAMNYSIPYMMSFTGVGYNKQKVASPKESWSIFESADYSKRTTLLNDMREVIGAALKYLGYSYNSRNESELQKAKELVLKWKKNIAKFDVDEAKRGLDSGEFFIVQQYSGDILQIIEENENIGFFYPAEGTSYSSDDFVIMKDSKNIDLAYEFINFCHDPQICAENMEFVFYMSPNSEALKLLDKETLNNPAFKPSDAVMKKSETIVDLGEDNKKYSKIWDEIKSGK
ncbi:MAG TPA: spermidine/putrescine ABC transporter substrate-binding protein [Spirochaetota bacterium]|nr:spermidine/putrescine ABC transporter substrate-binding protein [Spirochaetota bacterium]HOR45099.1 spermidine/putrescine ABC transporter substrate-binding protein [Spirochaetota bacterium]HPK56581.1 spermidine/putrescine ABC transporter substrate-binding protein [Spirochaetota bacterium]